MSTDAGVAAEAVAVSADAANTVSAATNASQVPLQFWLMAVLPLLVFFGIMLVRALPWSTAFAARKPLSCDACMSFWASAVTVPLLAVTFGVGWGWVLLHLLPTPGAVMFLLAWNRRLGVSELPLPPPLPPPPG